MIENLRYLIELSCKEFVRECEVLLELRRGI